MGGIIDEEPAVVVVDDVALSLVDVAAYPSLAA